LVLIIDDDDNIRCVMRLALERVGHRVISAHNGAEAIALFRSHQEEINLIVLDFEMPDMNGDAVCRVIRQMRRDIPVVLCSGSPPESTAAAFADGDLAGRLAKPFSLSQLETAVRTATAAAVPSSAIFSQ
jgi:CheY-like chemotaxis protein